MADSPHRLRSDERLNELHWVLSHHVYHLGRMASEMDRLSLSQTAVDFRSAAAGWDKVLREIENVGCPSAPAIGPRVRGPALSPGRPPSALLPAAFHIARQRREASYGPGLSK